jgi:hypothetical protein
MKVQRSATIWGWCGRRHNPPLISELGSFLCD